MTIPVTILDVQRGQTEGMSRKGATLTSRANNVRARERRCGPAGPVCESGESPSRRAFLILAVFFDACKSLALVDAGEEVRRALLPRVVEATERPCSSVAVSSTAPSRTRGSGKVDAMVIAPPARRPPSGGRRVSNFSFVAVPTRTIDRALCSATIGENGRPSGLAPTGEGIGDNGAATVSATLVPALARASHRFRAFACTTCQSSAMLTVASPKPNNSPAVPWIVSVRVKHLIQQTTGGLRENRGWHAPANTAQPPTAWRAQMAHSQLRMPWTLPFHTQEVPHQGVSLLVGPSLRAHRAIATRQLMHLGNSVVLTRLVDLLSDVIEVTHIC